MIGFARPMGVALAFLALTYACLWMYLRAARAEALRAEWRETRPPLPEHRFVSNGLESQAPGLRLRLVVGVFVVPLALLTAAIWAFG